MTTPRLDSQPPSLDQMAQELRAAGWTECLDSLGTYWTILGSQLVCSDTSAAYTELQRRKVEVTADREDET